MATFARAVGITLVLALLVFPFAAVPQQLPIPAEESVAPGVSTIYYAGQALRFTTDVPLKVFLSAISPTRILLKFRAPSSYVPGGSSTSAKVEVYWENWSNEIYEGPPPTTPPWEGILLTEGGFTEK
jgi:hypothetical protein